MPNYPEHGYVESDDENIYYWKASTLWELSETMTVEDVPLDSFDWESDNFQAGEVLGETPLWRDVGDHAKRIINTDLRHPIVISAEGNIMDGMHRVLKCYVFGVPSVKAVRFGKTPPPDIVYPIEDGE